MKQSNVAKYAYAAGIVDGEGSFVASWRLRKDKTGHSHLSYETKISVSQKDGRIPDWFLGAFGGFITEQKPDEKHSKPAMYQWVINERKAYEFAKRILPFLRYKKEQCELFIRLGSRKIINTQRSKNGTYIRLDEHEKELRNDLIERLKGLKHIWRKSAALETKRANQSYMIGSYSPTLQEKQLQD